MTTEEQDPGLAVDLHDVRKVYPRKVEALRGIQMQARHGEVFGLLGPNGAGKSTLVKIMLTVVRATKASGTILGHRIGHKETLARVGYLPEKHRFPEYLTGRRASRDDDSLGLGSRSALDQGSGDAAEPLTRTSEGLDGVPTPWNPIAIDPPAGIVWLKVSLVTSVTPPVVCRTAFQALVTV